MASEVCVLSARIRLRYYDCIAGDGSLADMQPAEPRPAWPYADLDGPGGGTAGPVDAIAIPYLAWANRGDGEMKVWIPLSSASPTAPRARSAPKALS